MSTPDEQPTFFATSDPCWLGGPTARSVAGARLAVEWDGPAADVLTRDHRLLQRHWGVQPGVGAVVTLAADPRVPAEGFRIGRGAAGPVVSASDDAGAVRGYLHLLVHGIDCPETLQVPAAGIRMVDDWDNFFAADHMGSVERGYAGHSILFDEGTLAQDLSRLRDYARLLASVGINALSINNVNVHAAETHLLTTMLPDVVRVAAVLREYGIRTCLAVNFAAPVTLGVLETCDPLDADVRAWWRQAADAVYRAIPDFGGFVVKADSENRPGPFTYGRSHAEGANMLADALAPHGGTVFWRCFVYDCHQDWRDRSTDRARAAADHFGPLDGAFAQNVVLQVKYGPMDFQVREGISPLLTILRHTNVAVELQVTQEYTGHQLHVCYLGPLWQEVLRFGVGWEPDGGPTIGGLVSRGTGTRTGLVGVSNVGDDHNWTGHALAQANLYAYGRLAWDPTLEADVVLDEWIGATHDVPDRARRVLHDVMSRSWRTYEDYTAPLGVGWMVTPGTHYGPSIDGYEYSAWGTYHFADRDGIGVDRTVATGTGMTGLYPSSLAGQYESLETCPDELLLFYHHVPYTHRLHSGRTVIQHIYDTHFAGVEDVERMVAQWQDVRQHFAEAVRTNVDERLAEQLRCAVEWRDQVNTYFWRKSGIPDACGRRIF